MLNSSRFRIAFSCNKNHTGFVNEFSFENHIQKLHTGKWRYFYTLLARSVALVNHFVYKLMRTN